MKTKLFIPLILLFSLSCLGQGFKEKKEKIKALKVAYITSELSLTSDEAQKFWPIYNTFESKQFELRHKKMRSIINKFEDGGLDKLSEKEATSLIVQMEDIEDELYVYKKKYLKDLQTVISAKKIIKLKQTEEEFNRRLLKQFRGAKE